VGGSELHDPARLSARCEPVQQLPDLALDRQRRLPVELVSLCLREPFAELLLACANPQAGGSVLGLRRGVQPIENRCDDRGFQR
jgi:hypothetical protein